jgi:hypothetical protein
MGTAGAYGATKVRSIYKSGGVEATDTPPFEEALRENHNKVLSLNYVDLELFMTN